MIQPVGVTDHRVGHAAQIQQPVPVDVVARQPGDLQAEHQPGVPERDLGRQPREPRAVRQSRARDPEVLVDHHDLLARESQLDRALHQRVLAGGRLDVALNLRLGGLAQIHERLAAQMRRRSASSAHSPTLPPRAPARRRPSARSTPPAAPSPSARCSSPTSSHNATAGAGLSASSRRNCTIVLLELADHRARPGRHARATAPGPAARRADHQAIPASRPLSARPRPSGRSTPPGSSGGCRPAAPGSAQAARAVASSPSAQATGPPMRDVPAQPAPLGGKPSRWAVCRVFLRSRSARRPDGQGRQTGPRQAGAQADPTLPRSGRHG